jgi:HSF-type DNA-binding
MNVTQAQALLGVGGLSHLMEAAAALARLTGQCQLMATSQGQQQPVSSTMNYTQSQQQPQIQPPTSYLQQPSGTTAALGTPAMTTTTVPLPNVVMDDDSNQNHKENLSNGSKEIFPERLMALLNDSSLSEIITWLPHGRSFVIIRPDVFTEHVLPKHFPPVDARTASKYTSFTRKLNRW